jgi:Tfp pilus assembly protein FimT
MSGYEVPDDKKTWIYWVAIALLIVFVVIGLITFSSARSTAQAQDKADELIEAMVAAGADAPSRDQVVRVLGEDGGAICEDPGNALRRATLNSLLSNGASGPGQRPIIADERVVKFELLVIQTYCPDELEDFVAEFEDFDYADVIKE